MTPLAISHVSIKNFRGYGENKNRDDKFYCFENIDSYDFVIFNGFNGFGKTSFFEAIEWCLTNNVKRLDNFRTNSDIAPLKKSQYLVFIPMNDKPRKAEVIIEFNNGLLLKRITTATSLQQDDYRNLTKLLVNNEEVNVDTDIVEHSGVKYNLYEILDNNFLGQDAISDFIKRNKPEERGKKLMKLINLEVLNNIEDSINIKALSDVELNAERIELVKAKEKTDELFKTKNWKDVNDYLEKINSIVKSIEKNRNDLKFGEEWAVRSFIDNKLDTKKCFDFIRKAKNQHDRLQPAKNIYLNLQKHLNTQSIVKQVLSIYSNIEKLKILKEIDVEIFKKKENAEKVINKKNEIIAKAKEDLEIIRLSQDIWNDYLKQYDDSKKIYENFKFAIQDFSEAKEKCNKFLFRNHKNGEQEIKIIKEDISKIEDEELVSQISEVNKTIIELNDLIKKEKEKLSGLSNLNAEHVNVLNVAKSYIEKQEGVNECPICLNTRLVEAFKKLEIKESNNHSIKLQLIEVINKQVSAGNEKVEKLQKEISNIEKEIIEQNTKLLISLDSKLIKPIKGVQLKFENLIMLLKEKLNTELKNEDNFLKEQNKLKAGYIEEIEKYIKTYKEIYEEEFDLSKPVKQVNEKLLEEKKLEIKEIIKKMPDEYHHIQTKEDFVKLQDDLIEKTKNKDSIDIVKKKIAEIDLLSKITVEFAKFELTDAEEQWVIKSDNYENRIKQIDTKLKKLKMDKKTIENIRDKVNAQKRESLLLLERNPLINYVYNKINPHFRYKNLILKNDERGKRNDVNPKVVGSNVFLNHVFSEAQLNTLSLSIFLGMGISEKFTNFNQLYLDDPIQSMDDLNILALIDIFRSLIEIDSAKRVFIATHNDNFAKLLQIKMRNKNIMTVNFESYGGEGPEINYIRAENN